MHIERDATRRKQYYDRKFHCMEIIPGDIVLVRQKVFGTTRKIEDWWENPVHQVIEKMGHGPVYKIQKLGEYWRAINPGVTQKHVTPTDAGGRGTRGGPGHG